MSWRQGSDRFTAEEMAQARKEFEANKLRASAAEAARRERERERKAKKEEEEQKRYSEMKQQHAACARELAGVEARKASEAAPQQRPVSKRPAANFSPHTQAATESKRACVPLVKTCKPLYKDAQVVTTSAETFTEVALREGPCVPTPLCPSITEDAFKDGLTIVLKGDTYCTEGLSHCKWNRADAWQELASYISLETLNGDRVKLVADRGLGLKQLGSGTYNVVVEFAGQSCIPQWIPKDTALRVTRSDKVEGSYKYQPFSLVSKEAYWALFFAQNDVGIDVYAVAAFHGVRLARTLRYGTVYALQKSDADLYRALERASSFDAGAMIAVDVSELIFRASRCGVAFFDIKPGNILRAKDRQGRSCFRLTDFDPSFFCVCHDVDWRTLMLINLAMLSCHVRNGAFGEVGIGWATSVCVLLRQLHTWAAQQPANDWLFKVRSVCVDFDVPDISSPFARGLMLAIMSTSYFYGARVTESTRSKTWKWDHHPHQARIDAWRRYPYNHSSWPEEWNSPGQQYKPLISQLVDFATEKARKL